MLKQNTKVNALFLLLCCNEAIDKYKIRVHNINLQPAAVDLSITLVLILVQQALITISL